MCFCDESAIDAAVLNDEVEQAVHNGHIRSRPRSEVNVGLAGRRRPAWIDDDQARRSRSSAAVQQTHPQHRFGHRHVRADDENAIGDIDIGIRTGLAIGAERLAHGDGGGGGAEARVAIDVIGANAAAGDQAECVIFFEEKLPGVVKTDGAAAELVAHLLGAADD